jgi:hypothetical protein
MLVAVRNIIHILRGTRSGSWKVPAAIFVVALAFFAVIRGDTYLDMTVLVPIVIGWLFAFVVIVSSHVMVCKEVEHERSL